MLIAFLFSGLMQADAVSLREWWKGFCERHLIADEPWPGYADGYPPPKRWLRENGYYIGPWGLAKIEEGADLVPRNGNGQMDEPEAGIRNQEDKIRNR